MSRQPRRFQPGLVYHLISRFVDRNWFIQHDEERANYVALLGRALVPSDWRCVSYALMSNHIHLGVIAGSDPLDGWIRRVHAPFADTMNRAYGRIGAMFVRGPKALAVSPTAVGSVIAYIHNNPVRARVVDDASSSTWTSHRAYLRPALAPEWLHVDEGMALAGFGDPMDFHRWMIDPAREQFDELHDVVIANEIDHPVRAERAEIDPNLILVATANELGISLVQLRSRRRSSVEVIGRSAVVFCAQRFGLTGVQTAQALQLSPQAVSLMRNQGICVEAMLVGNRVIRRLEVEGVGAGVRVPDAGT